MATSHKIQEHVDIVVVGAGGAGLRGRPSVFAATGLQ